LAAIAASTVNQSLPKYYWLLATVHIAQHDRESATAAAQKYVELTHSKGSPEELADALISLGYCYFWFSDFDGAILRTEEALHILSRSDTKAKYVCMSNLAYYLGASFRDRVRALELAEKAAQYLGDEPLRTDTRGFVRMQFAENLEQLMLARQDFLGASQSDPGLVAAYKHLAEVDARIKFEKEKGSSSRAL
jgi:tetratricopeptide (TPR) repeat protein